MADDVVDDTDPDPPAVQRDRLERIRQAATGSIKTDDPVLEAFKEVRLRNEILRDEIDQFIQAMKRDISTERSTPKDDSASKLSIINFQDEQQMEAYLRGSAVAVAYMMMSIMKPEDPETARPHAHALGEAFQLTNFLRDVREDTLDYDRIYLPKTTLDRFGATASDISNLKPSESVRRAIHHELKRAENRYRIGVAGIDLLPPDCRFPVLLAAIFYAEYHRLIRKRGFDVLTSKPELTKATTLTLAGRAWWHWHRSRDPEAIFYRISPITPGPIFQRNETEHAIVTQQEHRHV